MCCCMDFLLSCVYVLYVCGLCKVLWFLVLCVVRCLSRLLVFGCGVIRMLQGRVVSIVRVWWKLFRCLGWVGLVKWQLLVVSRVRLLVQIIVWYCVFLYEVQVQVVLLGVWLGVGCGWIVSDLRCIVLVLLIMCMCCVVGNSGVLLCWGLLMFLLLVVSVWVCVVWVSICVLLLCVSVVIVLVWLLWVCVSMICLMLCMWKLSCWIFVLIIGVFFGSVVLISIWFCGEVIRIVFRLWLFMYQVLLQICFGVWGWF